MKKLIFISLLVLSACGSKNEDPTTPPPPTVPQRQPPPKPGNNAGTPVTKPGTPVTPVPVTPTPITPVTPVVGASPKVIANVVWDCRNSVTGKAMQINGYMTDLGEKYFIRPNGQGPVEVEKDGTYNRDGMRYCAKAGNIPDLSAWAMHVKGSMSEAMKGGEFSAVLTRYRNLSKIDCSQLGGLSDYDLREAYVCKVGPSAFMNPDEAASVPVEIANLGEAKYNGEVQEIRLVKRDTPGNTYVLLKSGNVLRLDRKLQLDSSFGENGRLTIELPREILAGDQMAKIFDLQPDNNGGFLVFGRLQRSQDLIVVHLTAKGDLLKTAFPNGYVTTKPVTEPLFTGDELKSAIAFDGRSLFIFYGQGLQLVRNGQVTNLTDKFSSPRKLEQMSPTANGGAFVTWWDTSQRVFVTKFNSDGSANNPLEPYPGKAMNGYYYGLEGTIPHPDGGFYIVYKTVERETYGYNYDTVKFERFSANNNRLNETFTWRNPTDGINDFIEQNLALKTTAVFNNNTLGIPVRWGARISDSKQSGVRIVDLVKNQSQSLHASVGMQNLGLDGKSYPWIALKDDGSIHTLAVYIDRDYTKRSFHLVLTKVSP